ncbi:MAG: pseudaminic acid synthase [Helicobacteraceae bacterium]|jgi:N-acetylneuraminate synthase|nr:pseudaminic acid synthase [Helicobacteraceae bacterium]
MIINNREISAANAPYIVAELSANHGGSLENALKAIDAAKNAGADAVKIQTYEPDTLTIDCDKEDFVIRGGLWSGQTLYDLYKQAHTPFAWHKALFDRARNIGVTLFSAPFDASCVDLLESLNAPAYKIASFELVDCELIEAAARTEKPLIISTGLASEEEIGEALEIARSNGAKSIMLLHCVSEYPAPIETANTRSVAYLQKRFKVEVGLSDHTLGVIAAVTSVALGAVLIEKHFAPHSALITPDSAFSVDSQGLSELKQTVCEAWKALGVEGLKRAESEIKNRVFRRSIYAVKNIKKGEPFTRENTRVIRPGYGLKPKELRRVLHSFASRDIERGEPILDETVADETVARETIANKAND